MLLEIEKLIYGGQSLAKTNDGYPIFIDNGCPKDIVNVSIIKRNKSYGIGNIEEITKPSPYRVKPFCPLHNVCGSCGLQHIEYLKQVEQKRIIVKETVSKIYGKEVNVLPVKFPERNTEYRAKVQYPVSQTKVSKRIIAGYYKKGTHEAINIKFCPVQPHILDELTEIIREKAQELNISGYNEKKHSGLLRHIIYRMSFYNKKILVTFVINSEIADKKIKKLAELLSQNENIAGVSVNFNPKKTNVITGEITQTLYGKSYIEEKIGDIKYQISTNSFFQVNPLSAKIIFDTAKKMIEDNVKNPTILDAYSGVSAFGLQMKDIAKEIICVEENKSSTEDALKNIKLNNAQNIQVINDDAAKTFEQFVKKKTKFDVVLLDPPRKGCGKISLDYAAKLSKDIIIYTSCNPSSLATDLKYLEQLGFEPQIIQPVDMFCHTPHIENVVLIKRKTA